MTILAYALLAWLAAASLVPLGWVAFVEICRWQDRQRCDLALSRLPTAARQRGLHLVGNQAVTSSAASIALPGEDAAEGTAPVDRASRLVPGGVPTTCP